MQPELNMATANTAVRPVNGWFTQRWLYSLALLTSSGVLVSLLTPSCDQWIALCLIVFFRSGYVLKPEAYPTVEEAEEKFLDFMAYCEGRTYGREGGWPFTSYDRWGIRSTMG